MKYKFKVGDVVKLNEEGQKVFNRDASHDIFTRKRARYLTRGSIIKEIRYSDGYEKCDHYAIVGSDESGVWLCYLEKETCPEKIDRIKKEFMAEEL